MVVGRGDFERPDAIQVKHFTIGVHVLDDQRDGAAAVCSFLRVPEGALPLLFQLLELLVFLQDVPDEIVDVGADTADVVVESAGKSSILVQDSVDDFSSDEFALEVDRIGCGSGFGQRCHSPDLI